MSYHEEDFADMLFAWPAVDGRIIHLYELDPTHVAAQPSGSKGARAGLPSQASRSALPFCLTGETVPAAILLELDPTHSPAA